MQENLIFFGIGSSVGIIGMVASQPIWLILLLAFLTGVFTYAGKLSIIWLRKYIKDKRK